MKKKQRAIRRSKKCKKKINRLNSFIYLFISHLVFWSVVLQFDLLFLPNLSSFFPVIHIHSQSTQLRVCVCVFLCCCCCGGWLVVFSSLLNSLNEIWFFYRVLFCRKRESPNLPPSMMAYWSISTQMQSQ